jgi:two-component system competent response regulator ComA
MIRIFYIEDHHVTITGFRTMFRPSRGEVQLAGTASSVAEAVKLANPDTFDIILLDLWLDDNEPMANVRAVINHFRSKPVVIFSGETRIHFIRLAFRLGVRGYLYKSAGREEVLRTLKRVMEGDTVYPELLRRFLLLDDQFNVHPGNIQLSERQKAILTLLSQGLTVKEIAEEKLFLSVSMVEKTLSLLREMFMVKTNVELITIILQQKESGSRTE